MRKFTRLAATLALFLALTPAAFAGIIYGEMGPPPPPPPPAEKSSASDPSGAASGGESYYTGESSALEAMIEAALRSAGLLVSVF